MTQHNKSGAETLGTCRRGKFPHYPTCNCAEWEPLPRIYPSVAPVADAGVKRPEEVISSRDIRMICRGCKDDFDPVNGYFRFEAMDYCCKECAGQSDGQKLAASLAENVTLRTQLTQAQGKNVELAERVKHLENQCSVTKSAFETLARKIYNSPRVEMECLIGEAMALLSSAASGVEK